MAQEAGVDSGVAQRQRFAVDTHRAILQRPHQLIGRVHQGVEIGAMLPAELVGGGNKHLQRRIARPRPHPGQAGVNAIAPLFHRDDRVRHPEAQIMMGMHPGGGLRLQHRLQGAEAVANVVHVHRPAGIHHIDTGRAIRFHLQRLLRQRLRGDHMAHHQKTDGVHPQLAGKGNMLRGDVRFAAVGGDPHHPRPGLIRRFQIVQRADARQQ